jgi:hypothetical protein
MGRQEALLDPGVSASSDVVTCNRGYQQIGVAMVMNEQYGAVLETCAIREWESGKKHVTERHVWIS